VSSLIGVPCYVPGGKHAQLRILYPFIGTALNDALVCGINVVYADGETPRRAVMLVSDGFENKSNTLTREVIDLALERGIMLYTVGVRGRQGLESGVLKQFSEETGGGYFELKNNTDLPATFARIGEELRRQYVFGFTPAAGSGTSPRAKRRLEVNALRPGLTTRARQVYMEATPVNALPGTGALTVDAPMSGPAGPITVTRSPNASTAMSPLAQRLLDYRPGQSAILPLTRDGLWSGAGDFRRDAIVWVDGGPTADAPRRRLVVATYVLEMLQEFEGALWKPGRQASGLLEWAWTQLEKSAPLPAERGWWTAALALVERSSMADGLRHHLTQAEKRFPNDDQWLLTRAIADELELRAAPNDDGSFPISRAFASRIAERFQQAAARPSMRAEALIRWAAYDSDMGRQDAALAQLAGVGPMEDQLLRFWHALVTGRALDRANRAQEAAEAYRKALAEFPLAQSAALGLAGALVNMRQLTDAAMFVRGAVDADASIGAEDPWDFFFTPDVRRWPGAITTLRNELVR
jgi:tetratricopeptide (TPR) repeat protein